jgi:hypothetical protein
MIENFTPQPSPLWVMIATESVATSYLVLGWEAGGVGGYRRYPVVQEGSREPAIESLRLTSLLGVEYVTAEPTREQVQAFARACRKVACTRAGEPA